MRVARDVRLVDAGLAEGLAARRAASQAPRRATGLATRLAVLPAALLLAACGTPVQPWQKGDLARPAMAFDGDRLDAAFTEHTYSSKEAAAGGAAVGGGGCGCN